ncbi:MULTISPECIES: polyketide synthase [unclassified Frankia]|uniref:beta-ketoacyl [acyl carrier protein] synthase domain-containing protein n=1 Tax=unclassified Frankia TaxID=2632575 RepID=UPI001EF45595|nr:MULTISPECIES: polyketide synthase [unclassified Frankia]
MTSHSLAPVAVIGMAARAPRADGAEAFWRLLRTGGQTMHPAPPGRLYDYVADPARAAAPVLSCLEDLDRFEPALFGIAPHMAAWMDPQQRLMLEAVWHTLESAGICPGSIAGQEVAVFISTTSADMRDRMTGRHAIDRCSAVGLLLTFVSNRISQQFDLRGPSITLDTACAGGLTAISQAVSGLRAHEFRMALAGGPNVLMHGHMHAVMRAAGALSRSGVVSCFSESADGYVRGEGAFCFALKLLDKAITDGDPVLAVIRGAVLNHDGRRGGLTRPDPDSQVELVRRTLAQADLEPSALGYIEAHAAGTSKGDPVEVQALVRLLRESAQPGTGATASGPQGRLWMGSVKANIGHLEGSSGAAGLAKAILVLRHRTIPLTPGVATLHPDIPVDRHPIDIARTSLPWPDGSTRRIGINAFGFGGANAHVLIEEPPPLPSPSITWHGPYLVPISTRTAWSLHRLAAALADLVCQGSSDPGGVEVPPPEFASVVWTLQIGRAQLPRRALLVVHGPTQFVEAAKAVSENEPHPLSLLSTDAASRARLENLALDAGTAALASRWLAGETVDWNSLWPGTDRPRRTTLVPYPFDRRRCWPEEAGRLHGHEGAGPILR